MAEIWVSLEVAVEEGVKGGEDGLGGCGGGAGRMSAAEVCWWRRGGVGGNGKGGDS